MDGPEVLSDNLCRANMTEADLRAKLREANVTRLAQVRAVVMGSTGDVSVLHAHPDESPNRENPARRCGARARTLSVAVAERTINTGRV
ncbi:MAG: YetF domain-containing protein [Salinibacter sp.]